jgi:hypothetical protein
MNKVNIVPQQLVMTEGGKNVLYFQISGDRIQMSAYEDGIADDDGVITLSLEALQELAQYTSEIPIPMAKEVK